MIRDGWIQITWLRLLVIPIAIHDSRIEAHGLN